jgi:hypothetical protein
VGKEERKECINRGGGVLWTEVIRLTEITEVTEHAVLPLVKISWLLFYRRRNGPTDGYNDENKDLCTARGDLAGGTYIKDWRVRDTERRSCPRSLRPGADEHPRSDC